MSRLVERPAPVAGQNDDSIKLFASGMVVSDVIVWNLNNGAAFQLGWWSTHNQRDILVERVTVLHAEWRNESSSWLRTHPANNDAIVDLRGPGGGTPKPSKGGDYSIRNITWRDLVVDSAVAGGGLLWLDLANATGSVESLRFERVSLLVAMPSAAVEAVGQRISGLEFVDVEVGGACVRSSSEAGFVVGGSAASFTCSADGK